MKILLSHQNFPGQFKHLCNRLSKDPNHQLVFLSKKNNNNIEGVRRIDYALTRDAGNETHHYIREYERGMLYGQAVARVAHQLKKEGFVPDIMLGHNGWGETLFLKEIYPEVPLVSYFEFFYRAKGADTGFDPDSPVTLDDLCRIRAKNSINLLGLEVADWGLSPTEWQRSRYPEIFWPRISVIHEGIDTNLLKPNPDAFLELGSGRRLTRRDEIVTYISRNLEPYRGFHIFMKAVPEILKRRPNAIIVIVGGDDVSYGRKLPPGETYREKLLKEVEIDPSRVFFLGRIPYNHFVALLQLSRAHVYLTYPFVLSWSMLEAMSTGCLIVGSRTPPVEEVIDEGRNGLLVDFFSPGDVAAKVNEVLSHPDQMQGMRDAARRTIVDGYDLETRCWPQLLSLVEDLTAGRSPRVWTTPTTPSRTAIRPRAMKLK